MSKESTKIATKETSGLEMNKQITLQNINLAKHASVNKPKKLKLYNIALVTLTDALDPYKVIASA